MKKKILKLFVYSFLMFIGFSNIVDAKNVTVDELVTAIGKSKVAVVEAPPFDPDKVYIITSCTFTAKKTNDGFSYTPSCMVENAPQPTEEVKVSYSNENNTISFKFPGETVGTTEDYMHYFIAEALGKTNVKETLDNSTYKNEGCDLLNRGYCQENGIITYELSDKNYNYLLSGSPSIGEPPLPTEPDPITPEEIKKDLEEIKKKLDEYIEFANKVEKPEDLQTEEEKAKYLIGSTLKQTKITIKENGIDFEMENKESKSNVFVSYDGKVFSYDYNKDYSSVSLGDIVLKSLMMIMTENNNISYDKLSSVLDHKEEYKNYVIGDFATNGFEIEKMTIDENSSLPTSFTSRFKISATSINLDNVSVTNLDDGKGNNGVVEPDNKDNKEENNGVGIENPNTGYFVTIILLLSLGAVSIVILSSKHRKYYKI